MKQSNVKFNISLDDNNIPEKIIWDASDKGDGAEETKSIMLAIWDEKQQSSLRMDLWTKEMTVEEMQKFAINSIGGIGESLKMATNDPEISEMIQEFCRTLVDRLEQKNSDAQN